MGYLILILIAAVIILALYLNSQSRIKNLEKEIEERAASRYSAWRDNDLARVRAEQRDIADREARADFQQWQIASEANIRADAIMRSQAVITGKVSENVAPYMPIFPFNPKDVRFVGSPIDLIVFDGAAEGAVREVIFLEVKTGHSSLVPVQRQIRDAVNEGRVKWRELRIPTR